MAIYTQYGRYLKAKMFKEKLETQGDTYMLLGLGNPEWDEFDPDATSSVGQRMPIAPFDTSIMLQVDEGEESTEPVKTQFYDNNAYQAFIDPQTPTLIRTIENSKPEENTFIEKCKNLIPPFPCIWHKDGDALPIFNDNGVTQNIYENYYIDRDHKLHDVTSTSDPTGPIDYNGLNNKQKQYFVELYLRGLAISGNIKTPVGLLGAIKCDISYVIDLGLEDKYTGDPGQFWYGDRYWQIVDVDDSKLENYIKEEHPIYPHHLLFTATVNPMQLCADFNLDQSIVPRQLALYSRRIKKEQTANTEPSTSTESKTNNMAYRVDNETVFNFGQYTKDEIARLDKSKIKNILNFTLPATVEVKSDDTVKENEYTDGEFKFILHDYIKGSIRDKHSVDRFGYVIGF